MDFQAVKVCCYDSGDDVAGEGKPQKQPLPALKSRRAQHGGRRRAGRLQGQYRQSFEESSGFNNSVAAREGQAANASDVSHISHISQAAEETVEGNTDTSQKGEHNANVESGGIVDAGGSQESSVESSVASLPMVALLFLTRAGLPHESTWRLFLESIPKRGIFPPTLELGLKPREYARAQHARI